jgi:hypothetical protein
MQIDRALTPFSMRRAKMHWDGTQAFLRERSFVAIDPALRPGVGRCPLTAAVAASVKDSVA